MTCPLRCEASKHILTKPYNCCTRVIQAQWVNQKLEKTEGLKYFLQPLSILCFNSVRIRKALKLKRLHDFERQRLDADVTLSVVGVEVHLPNTSFRWCSDRECG